MYKMKKITLLISGLVLSTIVSTTSAQQLQNNGFEEWEAAGNTYQSNKPGFTGGPAGNKARPGNEPVSWEGSSVHQTVINQTKEETLVTQGTDNGNYVILTNKFVGVAGIGATAPGFLSLATPWVYATTNVSKCDGGVFGGLSFTYRPDAVVGKFKRTDSNNENSHIIAYLWNGTFKSNIKSDKSDDAKEDVERAVLASAGIADVPTTSTTLNGTLVAYCDYKFKSTTDSKWQTIEVPLTYVNTDTEVVPQKINVILSAADYWTRTNLKKGTSLCVDDVKLLYYSRLESLSVGGYEVPVKDVVFNQDGVCNCVAYVANPTNPKYTFLGGAPTKTVTSSIDKENNIYSITVTNNTAGETATDIDGKKSHTYNVKYMSQTTGYAAAFYNGIPSSDSTPIPVDYMKEADGTYALTFGDNSGDFGFDDAKGPRTPSRTVITGVTMTVDSDGCYVFTKDGATQGSDYTVSLVNDGATKCIYDPKGDGKWIFNFDVNYSGNVTRVTVTSDVTLSGVNGMNLMKERVIARSGAIEVSGFDGVAEVYTIDGRLVAKTTVAGNAQIAASNGIYLVRTPNTVKKVIVR